MRTRKFEGTKRRIEPFHVVKMKEKSILLNIVTRLSDGEATETCELHVEKERRSIVARIAERECWYLLVVGCLEFRYNGLRDIRPVSLYQDVSLADILETAMICSSCRKSYSSINFNSSNNSLNEPSEKENERPQNKRIRLSREAQLEQMLDGLKSKLSSLPPNDPLIVSLLTIAPECWRLRDIESEFNVSLRNAKKARDWKDEIFENFRTICLKAYGLDPAHYYTAPGE
ncbi:hypothetical protein TSAR_006656 [Trichomalopsis sarcophagae]|uniref:Uncharacterized protein n=1 Tax=Trichomalopsis sarcophagae TaxID=543379 RepID=A0A232EH29_9HYME|nr:hypothetical protein TSAR_006656 [Trichomalopsis sarcophagae]